MNGWFRRRPRGRHCVGAPQVLVLTRAAAPPATTPQPPVTPPAETGRGDAGHAPEPAPVPELPRQREESSSGPRVSLGFRDGSTAALDPGSEQARALAELSALLAGHAQHQD